MITYCIEWKSKNVWHTHKDTITDIGIAYDILEEKLRDNVDEVILSENHGMESKTLSHFVRPYHGSGINGCAMYS